MPTDNLKHYYRIVEECISFLGIDPAEARGKKPGQWSLVKGSATVWLDVWYDNKERKSVFQVVSPIMELPAEKLSELYAELLSLNHQLFGVAFTTHKQYIWLRAIREASGMDSREALSLLTNVGKYADKYDDYLLQKYNSSNPKQTLPPGQAPV